MLQIWIKVTLSVEISSVENFVSKKYSSAKTFVTKRFFRHFLPTKFLPIRYWHTKRIIVDFLFMLTFSYYLENIFFQCLGLQIKTETLICHHQLEQLQSMKLCNFRVGTFLPKRKHYYNQLSASTNKSITSSERSIPFSW